MTSKETNALARIVALERKLEALTTGRRVAVSLGVPGADDALAFTDKDGNTTAAISTAGDLSAASLAIGSDPVVCGLPMLGTAIDPTAGPAILDNWPRGSLGVYDFRGLPTMTSTFYGGGSGTTHLLGQFECSLPAGRTYRIHASCRVNPAADGTPAQLSASVRGYWQGTPDGTEPADPTGTSADGFLFDSSFRAPASGATGVSCLPTAVFPIAGDPSTVWRVKIALAIYAAAGTKVTPSKYSSNDWLIYVEDAGPVVEQLPAGPPDGASVQQYVTTWAASDSRTWLSNGTRYDTGTGTRPAPGGLILQGGAGSHGAIVFNGSGVNGESKTIAAALSGATVTRAEVFLQMTWAEETTGQVEVRPWTGSTLPTTKAPPGASADIVKHDFTGRGQGRWVQIPTSWITTSQTGVWIASPDWLFPNTHINVAGASYSTAAARPQLRLTYTR
ncbi:hypothetical protein [Flexivirga sp.]|uniref:hypothetical protein n=1 Tax=Flexivirga sp. TaxID=1962927 RepID=UPI003F805997